MLCLLFVVCGLFIFLVGCFVMCSIVWLLELHLSVLAGCLVVV